LRQFPTLTFYPRSTPGSFFRGFWFSSLRRCWLFYVAALVILAGGCAWGAQGAYQLDRREAVELEKYLTPILSPKVGRDKQGIFWRAALRNTLTVGVVYLAGLAVIGAPLVAGILFLRGYPLGFTGGFIVLRKGVRGLGILMAGVLPHQIILLLILVIAAVASFSFSLLLFKRWFNSEITVFPWFLRYTGLMVLLAAAAIGAGLIEAYVVPGFARMVLSCTGR